MLVFIETRLFSRLATEYLPDDELARLQHYLNENPQAGDLIRESDSISGSALKKIKEEING